MFRGAIVALVTPFQNGGVDEKALREIIERCVAEGVSGFVPCGSTGESATLSHREHKRVVELTVEVVNRRARVIAGTGSNATAEAIDLTRHAKECGADGALLISPYYNKPTQEGLFLHYEAVAREVDLPILLYNIPGRTAVNMLPQTIARLSEIPNIVGVKEASGNLQQIADVVRLCGPEFDVFSGDDSLTLPILAVGGCGVISSGANVVPRDFVDLCAAWDAGDAARARAIHLRLLPLCEALTLETNPIALKAALHLLGRTSDEIRLPLTKLSAPNQDKLRHALKDYGLL